MDRSSIVGYFFEKGQLLSPSVLGDLSPMEDSSILSVRLSGSPVASSFASIRVISEVVKSAEITVDDAFSFSKSRFEKLSEIIRDRVPRDFVSMSNASGACWVIAAVRSASPGQVEIEDMTARATLACASATKVDDVAAFLVDFRKRAVEKVAFPDVPLRLPRTAKGRIAFVFSEKQAAFAGADVIFLLSSLSNKTSPDELSPSGDSLLGDSPDLSSSDDSPSSDFIIDTSSFPSYSSGNASPEKPPISPRKLSIRSNPFFVSINNVNILVTTQPDVLKRRHLGVPPFVSEGSSVLEELPDIIFSPGNYSVSSYKSITLLSSDEPVVVDLQTREVRKMREDDGK